MITAVDTNILLDILLPDKRFALSSKDLLDTHNQKGQLIICELVYAELSSQFPSAKNLDEFLLDTSIRLQFSNKKALALSGARWSLYSKNRKKRFQCPVCGKKINIQCSNCNNSIAVKQHILSDFIIASHALVQAETLLSRDRGFFKTYFNDLIVKDKL